MRVFQGRPKRRSWQLAKQEERPMSVRLIGKTLTGAVVFGVCVTVVWAQVQPQVQPQGGPQFQPQGVRPPQAQGPQLPQGQVPQAQVPQGQPQPDGVAAIVN